MDRNEGAAFLQLMFAGLDWLPFAPGRREGEELLAAGNLRRWKVQGKKLLMASKR